MKISHLENKNNQNQFFALFRLTLFKFFEYAESCSIFLHLQKYVVRNSFIAMLMDFVIVLP